jgi:hypothetical protein
MLTDKQVRLLDRIIKEDAVCWFVVFSRDCKICPLKDTNECHAGGMIEKLKKIQEHLEIHKEELQKLKHLEGL